MFASIRPRCLHALETRAFSTTSHLGWKSHKQALAETHADLPPYPYGPARWFKQSDKGLYGGARLQFGNNVSPRTEIKTRRKWHLNVKRKSMFSKALNRRIRVRVSTRVMRTIDKVGGLDEYLLGEKSARIKELGMEGWRLRCMVMATPAVQARFNAQRRLLGVPEVDYAALALEAASLPPELINAAVDDLESEFVVEGDEEAEEIAIAGGDVQQANQGPQMDFAERVEAAKQAVRA